ncbi:hypothetical protein [Castellaniella sp.]|uniref:hypothetical protein n=1 Tax=Castellaniella sp. TaxID=1955812 RepID=UPI002AFEC531|nr:hypothetical protein [Castellaniella sp.]
MQAIHSVWLMPCAQDAASLAQIIRQIAAACHTPVFEPHLTLVEDMPRSADDIAARLSTAFAGQTALACPITTVSGLPTYFRSLFAAFKLDEALQAAKTTAMQALDMPINETFTPHISLGYGIPEDQKARHIHSMDGLLRQQIIHFDAIVVAQSGKEIPIDQWRAVRVHRLH